MGKVVVGPAEEFRNAPMVLVPEVLYSVAKFACLILDDDSADSIEEVNGFIRPNAAPSPHELKRELPRVLSSLCQKRLYRDSVFSQHVQRRAS